MIRLALILLSISSYAFADDKIQLVEYKSKFNQEQADLLTNCENSRKGGPNDTRTDILKACKDEHHISDEVYYMVVGASELRIISEVMKWRMADDATKPESERMNYDDAFAKAVADLKKASDLGVPEADYTLLQAYKSIAPLAGVSEKKSIEQAIIYGKKAAAAHWSVATVEVADIYVKQNQNDKALQLLRDAVRNNEALPLLSYFGLLHKTYGRDLPPNILADRDYAQKVLNAAIEDKDEKMSLFGKLAQANIYWEGLTLPEDKQKAVEIYKDIGPSNSRLAYQRIEEAKQLGLIN